MHAGACWPKHSVIYPKRAIFFVVKKCFARLPSPFNSPAWKAVYYAVGRFGYFPQTVAARGMTFV